MKLAYAMVALMVVSLAGCATTRPIEGRLDPHEWPQIAFADPDLADKTRLQVPVVQRDEHGHIRHITLPIRSASRFTLYVDHRATFFGPNGAVLSQTGWMGGTTLVSHVPSEIQVAPPVVGATDFRIDLRYAR